MAVKQTIRIDIEDADRDQVGVKCDSKKVMDFLNSGKNIITQQTHLTGGEQLAVVMFRAAKQYIVQHATKDILH